MIKCNYVGVIRKRVEILKDMTFLVLIVSTVSVYSLGDQPYYFYFILFYVIVVRAHHPSIVFLNLKYMHPLFMFEKKKMTIGCY